MANIRLHLNDNYYNKIKAVSTRHGLTDEELLEESLKLMLSLMKDRDKGDKIYVGRSENDLRKLVQLPIVLEEYTARD